MWPNTSVYHTSAAIKQTYNVTMLLHRDVSYGNVMTTSDGRGILNDWDPAGAKDKLASGIS